MVLDVRTSSNLPGRDSIRFGSVADELAHPERLRGSIEACPSNPRSYRRLLLIQAIRFETGATLRDAHFMVVAYESGMVDEDQFKLTVDLFASGVDVADALHVATRGLGLIHQPTPEGSRD